MRQWIHFVGPTMMMAVAAVALGACQIVIDIGDTTLADIDAGSGTSIDAAGPGGGTPDGGMASCISGGSCDTGNPCEVGEIQCVDGQETCAAVRPASADTSCRPAAGACDAAEFCDGESTACPADGFAPTGDPCQEGSCNGLGMCIEGCIAGTPCSTGKACEVGAIDCSSGEPQCVTVGLVEAGTVCRQANGLCDLAETCDGTSAECPADEFASVNTPCRDADGVCDVAEKCTGTSAACPINGFAGSSTPCRAKNGDCDVAEKCTGTSAACPTDGFAGSSTTCRNADGVCDVAEKCTGSSRTCPTDRFASSSTTCRAKNGTCDVAEKCTGSSRTCPTDRFASSSTPCREADGVCDATERCTGSSRTCPADADAPNGSSCGFSGECYERICSSGSCIQIETCDIGEHCCPDGCFPDGTQCR